MAADILVNNTDIARDISGRTRLSTSNYDDVIIVYHYRGRIIVWQ